MLTKDVSIPWCVMVKPYPGTGSNEVQWSCTPPPQTLIIQTDSSGICFQTLPCQVPCLRKCQVSVKKMAAFTDAERKNETTIYLLRFFFGLVVELKVCSLESGWMNYCRFILTNAIQKTCCIWNLPENLHFLHMNWCNASVTYDLSWSSYVVIPRILSNNRVPFGAPFPSMKCALVEWN